MSAPSITTTNTAAHLQTSFPVDAGRFPTRARPPGAISMDLTPKVMDVYGGYGRQLGRHL